MLSLPLPSPLMSTFLTVKEAAHKTGRSTSFIRRLIYSILAEDNHPDRLHIEPSVEQVLALRIQGENFAWRLSEEFLDREVAARAPVSPASEPASGGAKEDPSLRELVSLLRSQLEHSQQQLQVKDQQLDNLSELMKSLNERLREGNILIGSLQRQFALPEATAQPISAVTTHSKPSPKPSPQPARPAARKPATKAPKPSPKAPAKQGFLARLFS